MSSCDKNDRQIDVQRLWHERNAELVIKIEKQILTLFGYLNHDATLKIQNHSSFVRCKILNFFLKRFIMFLTKFHLYLSREILCTSEFQELFPKQEQKNC